VVLAVRMQEFKPQILIMPVLNVMPSELCEFIFKVQIQLQKIMCCKRQVFGGSFLVWGLPAGKIRLEDMNEVNVSNDSVEFW
jgi:hypothetical protein